MEGYGFETRIDSELFAGMREDADRVLQKLLKNMDEKGSLEGQVTIRIDITFTQEFIPNRDPNIQSETRRVLTPKFSHKIGSVMQIKNEAKGDRNCDGFELVFDEKEGEYVLKPIANTEQMTIFDADFRCVNDPDEEEEECDGQATLAGRRIAALPGPFNKTEEEADGDAPCGGTEAVEGGEEDISDSFEMNPPEDMQFMDDDYGYEEPEWED